MVGKLSIALTLALACLVLAAQAWAATSRSVSLRDNFITVLDCKTATRAEIVLNIHDNQRVLVAVRHD